MGNPAEQAAAEQAAVTDGTPGLEQFDEAEISNDDDGTTYEVAVSGWLSVDLAHMLADYLRSKAGQLPKEITIEVRTVPGGSK